MDPLDDYFQGEMLLDISDAQTLLTPSQEEDLSTFQYLETFQEPQSNRRIIYSSSSVTGTLPSMESYFGLHHFEVFISAEATGPDCLYSKKLNKIFVNIEKVIPVLFCTTPHIPGLYVRAVAIYTNCENYHVPVKRCATHETSDIEGNKDIELSEHVVRCISPNARYFKDTASGRTSVRVQLDAPQIGANTVKMCYKFTCLNSCQIQHSRGVIFTLEDENEEVLGRQSMNIRVCSCPKRDKDKEESEKGKTKKQKKVLKRSVTSSGESEGPKKFFKSEPGEIPLISIPVKLCHVKELAKFASDLIYRDVAMEQRTLNDQDKHILAEYRHIIETPDEELRNFESPVCKLNRISFQTPNEELH